MEYYVQSFSSYADKVLSSIRSVVLELFSFAQQEPLISLFIILLAAFLSIGLVYLGNYIYITYLRKKSTEFLSLLKDEESVAILLHPHPDPDAMSSGMAVSRLAEEVNTNSSIYFSGRISHHENRAFLAVLDISFTKITSKEDIEEDTVVVVDHSEPRGFEGAEDIVPDAIIDHHDVSVNDEVEFVHVERDIGASATLLTEYLSEKKILSQNVDHESHNPDLSKTLATGLYYGIKTDTSDFLSGVDSRDYDSARKLYPHTDTDKLYKIANPKIDIETFEIRAKSFYSLERDGPFGIANVGEVKNSDAIPQSADELVQLEGLSAVIILGDVGESYRISARTYDDRVHMGMVLEQVVEEIPDASAGGHSRMGGGQIPKKSLEQNGFTLDDLETMMFDSLKGFDIAEENKRDTESDRLSNSPTNSEGVFIYGAVEEHEQKQEQPKK